MGYFYETNSITQASRVLAGKTAYLAVRYKGIEFHRSNNRKIFGTGNISQYRAKKHIKAITDA